MDDLQSFEKLAAAARRDAPPMVDVTAGVKRAIHGEQPPSSDRVLYVFSALSAVAAVIVALMTVTMYRQTTDPLVGLVVEASRIVQ